MRGLPLQQDTTHRWVSRILQIIEYGERLSKCKAVSKRSR